MPGVTIDCPLIPTLVRLSPPRKLCLPREFAQCGYIVVPFLPGYDDVAGRRLKLDHIADPTLRPLDELPRDHFFQAVMKNMKGGGEPNWDYEEALDDGVMDLSRTDIWGDNLGREHLEFELAHRLHDIIVSQTVQSS